MEGCQAAACGSVFEGSVVSLVHELVNAMVVSQSRHSEAFKSAFEEFLSVPSHSARDREAKEMPDFVAQKILFFADSGRPDLADQFYDIYKG